MHTGVFGGVKIGMISCAIANPGNFFTNYITPLASPLIAMAVGVVAYQQWRTSRDKLRFDLYARRLNVYDAAMNYLEMSIRSGNGYAGDETKVRSDFISTRREARFLFGEDSQVYGILSAMERHVSTVMTPTDSATALYDSEAHKAEMQRRSESISWIVTAGDKLSDAIRPFLDFRRLQNVGSGSPPQRIPKQSNR